MPAVLRLLAPPALVLALLVAATVHLPGRSPAPGSCHARGHGAYTLPDPRCTPGASDPRVDQADLQQTICSPGWSGRARASEPVSEPERRAALLAYGDRGLHAYEYDRLIPLELGGAPGDPHNLWPEPGSSPNPKDRLEDRLHELVCAGRLGLVTATRAVASNWIAARHRYVG